MLKKTIKYKDYNGVEREEDFYFDLSPAEITEMELSEDGGMSTLIQKIVVAKDMKSLVAMFKELILKSYGEKSADGRRFIKVDHTDGHRLADDFAETPAYSILFMELATNENAAQEFVNGIIPQEALANQQQLIEKK